MFSHNLSPALTLFLELPRGSKISRIIPSPGPFHPTSASMGTSPTTRRRDHRKENGDDQSVLIGLNSRSSTLDNEEIISPPSEEPAPTSAWRSRFYESDLNSFESGVTVIDKQKETNVESAGWFYSTIDEDTGSNPEEGKEKFC